MNVRKRGAFYHLGLGNSELREKVINWKKQGNDLLKEGIKPKNPPCLKKQYFQLLEYGIEKIDYITVPPPSFHEYEIWYPAVEVAKELTNRDITIFWGDRYEKKGKVWHSNIDKIYKKPSVKVRGKTVLILDDIVTTGLTLSACCTAIAKEGGYPIAIASV